MMKDNTFVIMAHKSFTHNGYDIWIATPQLSKQQRGGSKRSLQICKLQGEGRVILKQIAIDTNKPDWFGIASDKAIKYIDEVLNNK